jgi:hypothetical protein
MEKVNAGVNALLELHIPGISFAPSMTSRVRVGATSCQATFWNSTAGVHCKVAPGNGPSVRLILTSGGSFVSSATVGFSFDQIAYPAVGGSNQPTFQGEFFLLVDRSQGLVQYSSQFRFSSSACESTLWISATSVSALASTAVGSRLGVSLTVGCAVGSLSDAFSIDAPSLSSIRKNESTGGKFLYIEGNNFAGFDSSPVVLLGETKCIASVWQSDTSVFCNYATIVGFNLIPVKIMMYSDAGGEISRAFSADSPIFRQVLPNNIPSAVPPVSFIHGQNFGSSTQSFVGRMAGTHCKSTEWISDSAIAVRSAEGIVGFGSTVITIEQQIATLEHAFSSDVPILAHLNQSNSNLTVHGLNFGINDGTLQMRAGFSSAISTEWL